MHSSTCTGEPAQQQVQETAWCPSFHLVVFRRPLPEVPRRAFAAMAAPKRLAMALAVLLVLVAHACAFPAVPKMRKRLVRRLESRACVRWLSRNQVHGCAARVQDAASVLLRFQDRHRCPKGARCALLATCDEAKDAMDADLDVAGVLLDARVRPPSLSFVGKHPQMQFEAMEEQKHVWNDAKQLAMVDVDGYLGHLDQPVYLLSDEDARELMEHAVDNVERIRKKEAVHVVDMKLDMKAANDPDSVACLRHGTCLPLGGYSVIAAMPNDLNANNPGEETAGETNEDVVVTFSLDGGFSMFRDNVTAARQAMAGLVATLVAAEALAQAPKGGPSTKRIIFAGMAGDAFGYLGTRRFWSDWHAGQGPTLQQLGKPNVAYVVDVGSLGRLERTPSEGHSKASELYYHPTTQGANSKTLQHAIGWAAQAPEASSVRPSTPKSGKGLPPSSLQALVDVVPGLVGASLTDFDDTIGNPYLGGFFDDFQEVDLDQVARSAMLLANALHALRTGLAEGKNVSQIDHLKMPFSRMQERVNELADCVMRPSVGFQCKAAREFFSPNENEPFSHFVGVLPSYSVEDDLELGKKKNMQKLVWSILGAAVADSDYEGVSCQGTCSNPGEVCLGYRSALPVEERNGTCKRATVGYTVSLEPAFEYAGSGLWKVVADPSDPHQRAPLFTESYWGSDEDLRVLSFLALTPRQANIRLVAGILVTGLSIAIAFTVRRLHDKRHKWH